jgi:DNA-binding NtrC family response regulator
MEKLTQIETLEICGSLTTMKALRSNKPAGEADVQEMLYSAVEKILEKKLDELATVLSVSGGGKSRLHAEVMAMVEKGLFNIALKRSNYVKSSAAAFLGINRNTFTDKMTKLGVNGEKNKLDGPS